MKYLRVLPAFKILPEKSRILYWRFLPSGRIISCLLTFLFPLTFGPRRSKVQRCNPIPPCSSPKTICPLILELIENTFSTWLVGAEWEDYRDVIRVRYNSQCFKTSHKQCFWPVCVTLECHFFPRSLYMGWFWGKRNGFLFLKLLDSHKLFHHATQKECYGINEKGNEKGKCLICNTPTISPATVLSKVRFWSFVAPYFPLCFLNGSVGRRICLPLQEMQVQSLGQADPLEKEMAAHSRILAWKIPWTEEPGRLQSLGSQRVGLSRREKHFPLYISFPLPYLQIWILQEWEFSLLQKCMTSRKEVRLKGASLVAQMVKNPPAMLETGIPSISWDNTLEKGMATHSSILARRMPCTEEPAEM